MQVVTLAHEADVAGWRDAARRLLQQGEQPDTVDWQVQGGETPGLFDPTAPPADAEAEANAENSPAPPRVPAGFVALASQALLHRDPKRFHLMYRLLWRLVQAPALRHDPLDPDMLAARQLAQQVRRDQYEMRAFLRFHEHSTPHGPEYVAWFEPQHHVVASQATFFQARFASMRWAIFTPQCSVSWDGTELRLGSGARREDIPLADARTSLWLTYYASIFNPARPKPAHMQQQMPRRLWHNLPEAPLIAPLMAAAAHRTDTMVAHGPGDALRRRPALPPSATDADAWAAALDRCRDCPHAAHATQAVPGEGPRDAPVVLVGEQPGDMEDLLGRPFAGPAGRLLDQALAAAGLARERLYLTNAVKHFRFELRGKRRLHKTPGQREIENCRGWLERELGAMPARHLVALGSTAAQSLLGRKVGIGEHRGQWLPTADGREVLVTWHPAALLRMPPEQRDPAFETWVGDLRRVAEAAIR